jgi:hypothetical protein
VICEKREAENFFKRDWTGQISLIRFDKFDFARKSVARGNLRISRYPPGALRATT